MIEFIMTVGKWTVPFVYNTRCTNKLIPCIYLFNVSELKWFNRVVALAFNPPFIEESHRLIVTYTSIAMEMLNYTITIKVNCWCTKVEKKKTHAGTALHDIKYKSLKLNTDEINDTSSHTRNRQPIFTVTNDGPTFMYTNSRWSVELIFTNNIYS